MEPEKAKRWRPAPLISQHSTSDAIIFALGVGATTKTDLHYLYENHDNFQVFPTFAIRAGLPANRLNEADGVVFDLQRILHGEQFIELFGQFPDDAEIRAETRILDVLDKKSMALVLTEVILYDNKSGKKLARLESSTVQLGYGNFGGASSYPQEESAVRVPDRKPDYRVEEATGLDQAALYRYGSGDLNPLHVDPNFAKMSGFKQPILHGMCTLGISVRAVLRDYGGNDAANFLRVKARFSAPVTPGDVLVVEMWRGSNNRVHFQTKIKDSGKIVISSAYVDFNNIIAPKL